MKYLTKFRRLGTLVFLLTFSGAAFSAPQYAYTDIGVLLGLENDSVATTISNNGHVAGHFWAPSDGGGGAHGHGTPFIYRLNQDIEIVGDNSLPGRINDLNDSDQFVGEWIRPAEGDSSGREKIPFIYRDGWVEGSPFTSVQAINNSGDVVGLIDVQRNNVPSSVAILKTDGTVINIMEGMDDSLISPNFRDVVVKDINDKGQVLFAFITPGSGASSKHVWVYTPGQGAKKVVSGSHHSPVGLNNNGVVVTGWSSRGHFSTSLFSSDDGTELATGDGVFSGFPRAISDSNVVAGDHSVTFSLTDASQLVDLGSSLSISDMNNNNIVVGEQDSKAAMFSPVAQGQITIDGSFDDWEGVTRFIDPAEDGGIVNWYEVWADDSTGKLSFSYSTFSYSNILNPINENERHLWNIYLDTDKQSTTGYNFELLGADYLLQGKNLYQYTGSGQDWAWSYLGDVDYAGAPLRVELSIAKSKLGMTGDASSYRALFYGANQDGSNVDYLLIDIEAGSGEVVMEEISIPAAE